jgi:hypothetical protein
LLSPVNPKTGAQNAIGAILWLDENLAGLLLIEPMLWHEECTDEVIEKSTNFLAQCEVPCVYRKFDSA